MESSTSTSPSPRVEASEAASAVMSMTRAQLLSIVLVVPIAALSMLPHWVLWGGPSGEVVSLSLVALFVAGVFVHEALHGLGYWWGGAPSSTIEFGFHWEGLAPYAHCSTALRTHSYRLAVLLPGLVLGILPLGIGLVIDSWTLTIFAFMMLIAAGGDGLLLWTIRDIPGDAWIQDHPSEVGGLVLGHASSSTPPVVADDLSAPPAGNSDEGVAGTTLIYIFLFVLALGVAVGVFAPMLLGG